MAGGSVGCGFGVVSAGALVGFGAFVGFGVGVSVGTGVGVGVAVGSGVGVGVGSGVGVSVGTGVGVGDGVGVLVGFSDSLVVGSESLVGTTDSDVSGGVVSVFLLLHPWHATASTDVMMAITTTKATPNTILLLFGDIKDLSLPRAKVRNSLKENPSYLSLYHTLAYFTRFSGYLTGAKTA